MADAVRRASAPSARAAIAVPLVAWIAPAGPAPWSWTAAWALAPLHASSGTAPPHWLVLLVAVFGVWAVVRVGVGAADALLDRFDD